MRKIHGIAGILAALALSGCGSSGTQGAQKLNFVEQNENLRFDNTDVKRQVFDVNHDGQVDLWKFYAYKKLDDVEGPGDLLLIRKELDLNFDGRIDRIMYYNQKEELVSEEIDTNFDGTIDRIHHYDKAILVSTEFFQSEGNRVAIDGVNNPTVYPNMVRFFRNGKMTREEPDAEGDGLRERYVLFDVEGKISQIGHDDDGDGVVEYWERM